MTDEPHDSTLDGEFPSDFASSDGGGGDGGGGGGGARTVDKLKIVEPTGPSTGSGPAGDAFYMDNRPLGGSLYGIYTHSFDGWAFTYSSGFGVTSTYSPNQTWSGSFTQTWSGYMAAVGMEFYFNQFTATGATSVYATLNFTQLPSAEIFDSYNASRQFAVAAPGSGTFGTSLFAHWRLPGPVTPAPMATLRPGIYLANKLYETATGEVYFDMAQTANQIYNVFADTSGTLGVSFTLGVDGGVSFANAQRVDTQVWNLSTLDPNYAIPRSPSFLS